MYLKRQNKPVFSSKRAITALFANAFRKTHLFREKYISAPRLYQCTRKPSTAKVSDIATSA